MNLCFIRHNIIKAKLINYVRMLSCSLKLLPIIWIVLQMRFINRQCLQLDNSYRPICAIALLFINRLSRNEMSIEENTLGNIVYL